MNTYNLEPNYRDVSLIKLNFVVLEISIPSFHSFPYLNYRKKQLGRSRS